MTDEDDWVKSARYNDSMVIEQLIRLKHEDTKNLYEKQGVLVLQWGVRQPRSRQIIRYDDISKGKKKMVVDDDDDDELTRASPTTPLSWSGGGGSSNSGGGAAAGGDEESSVRLCNARSKVLSPGECSVKRSRKKKTFGQLKEEESLLLKEGIHLKRALASERKLYKEEKVRNESLKRLKLDLQLQSTLKQNTSSYSSLKQTFHQSYQSDSMPIELSSTIFPAIGKHNALDPVPCRPVLVSEALKIERPPFLPDLNLLPDLNVAFEEEFS